LHLNEPVYFGKIILSKGELINYAVGLVPCITLIVLFMDGLIEVTRLVRHRRQANGLTHTSNGIL
jgi:hypothetical protein